jgi:hypothetical protein
MFFLVTFFASFRMVRLKPDPGKIKPAKKEKSDENNSERNLDRFGSGGGVSHNGSSDSAGAAPGPNPWSR